MEAEERGGRKLGLWEQQEAATNECSPKLKSSLMSPSVPLLIYSSISHPPSSALLLITRSPPPAASGRCCRSCQPCLPFHLAAEAQRHTQPVFTSQYWFYLI